MAAKHDQKRLNGPEVIDIDPRTGQIFDEAVDTSDLENDQDKLLDDIIGEFGAGDNEVSYSASVTRIPKAFQRGQKEPWLFECDAADIIGIRQKLRDDYRGGQFRIRVYKINSRGKKLHRQMDYHIEAPEATANMTGDAKVDAIAAALERTQTTMLQLAERLSNPSTPVIAQTDPFVMMERMSTIMKNMMPANAGAVAHDTMSVKDSMEIFTKGMELAETMRGDGSDSWISVFKEMAKQLPVADILKNLTELQQQKGGPQRRQLAGPQRQPGQQPQNIPPQQQPGQQNGATAQAGQLEQSMRYLIGKARNNSDPGLYAEWLLDNADRALIAQMSNEANVLDQLAVIFPALNNPPIREWFTELVENVKELLAQMGQNGSNGPGIGQNQTMNGQDAGTGSDFAPHTGRDPWDQGNLENNAGVGQDGP